MNFLVFLAQAATQAPQDSLLWTFFNSPLGITIIATVVTFALGLLFKAKPGWEKTFDTYRGHFFDAVRAAEKAIPDGHPNPSAAKADIALKLLLQLEPALAKRKEVDLKLGLTKAHDTLKARALGHSGA